MVHGPEKGLPVRNAMSRDLQRARWKAVAVPHRATSCRIDRYFNHSAGATKEAEHPVGRIRRAAALPTSQLTTKKGTESHDRFEW